MRYDHIYSWIRAHRKTLLLGASGALLILGAISCATTANRALFAPPQVAGATYVGTEDCAQCHGEINKSLGAGSAAEHFPLSPQAAKGYLKAQKGITTGFKNADHARLVIRGDHPLNVGCEACHGPGSVHSASGGEPNTGYRLRCIRPRSRAAAGSVAAARRT